MHVSPLLSLVLLGPGLQMRWVGGNGRVLIAPTLLGVAQGVVGSSFFEGILAYCPGLCSLREGRGRCEEPWKEFLKTN